MTRGQALDAILRGLLADLEGYRRLEALLGAHFDAALRHDSQGAADAGEAITRLAAEIETRRAERVGLARRLLRASATPAMAEVFAQMKGEARAQAEAAWAELERRVRDCKALNERNCRLIMDQFEIMQRVLDRETDVYAPA